MKSNSTLSGPAAAPDYGLASAYPPRGMRLPTAAEYIGVSESKFLQMVRGEQMPKPFKIGGVTLWDRHSIDRAFDELSYPPSESDWDDVHA